MLDSASEFYIKRGDRLPALKGTIKNRVTGAAENLTGATLEFHMRNRQTGVLKVDAAAALDGAATLGRVKYEWGATDTDTVGAYDAEIEATFAGKPLSSPNDAHVTVYVYEDLA